MIKFNYGKTKLDPGFYFVQVDANAPVVAEFLEDHWYQTGVDYDVWQYHAGFTNSTVMVLGPACLQPPDKERGGTPAPAPNSRVYPQDLTDDLRAILSLMMWNTGPMAHALRDGRQHIKRKAEEEQAEVMHWLISLALEHGSEWRTKASDRIREIQASVKAALKSESSK